MAKLILGLAGEMGSGKGAITKHIVQNYKANEHKFSQMLRDILDRIFVEQSRENITTLSMVLRKNFGEDIMAKTMYHEAFNDEKDIIVIDGVRRIEDMKYLKEIPYFKFIFIDADMQTRYERVVKRAENSDEMKKTFAQFQAAHEYETEKTIPDLKNYADYVIENNGTYLELYQQIDEIIKQNITIN